MLFRKKYFFFLFFLCSSCSDDFEPMSFLENLEILALVQNPQENLTLGLDSELNIKPYVFTPDGDNISSANWEVCFLSTGSFGDYKCAIEECSFQLAPGEDGSLVWPISSLSSQPICLGALSSLQGKINLTVMYSVSSTSGETKNAVLVLPFYLTEKPETQETGPKISSIKIAGKEYFGNEDIVEIEGPSDNDEESKISLDIVIDEGNAPEGESDSLVLLYSTFGSFSSSKLSGPNFSTNWLIEKYGLEKTEGVFYIVVTDKNGGQNVWARKILKN